MKAYDDQEKREKKAYESSQAVENYLICPMCGMPMIAQKRPGHIKWLCSSVDDCFFSKIEGE